MRKIIMALALISLIVLIGCDVLDEQELKGKELAKASCEDLYESIEKCDSTGLRTPGAREQCETNHLIFIKGKCTKD